MFATKWSDSLFSFFQVPITRLEMQFMTNLNTLITFLTLKFSFLQKILHVFIIVLSWRHFVEILNCYCFIYMCCFFLYTSTSVSFLPHSFFFVKMKLTPLWISVLLVQLYCTYQDADEHLHSLYLKSEHSSNSVCLQIPELLYICWGICTSLLQIINNSKKTEFIPDYHFSTNHHN